MTAQAISVGTSALYYGTAAEIVAKNANTGDVGFATDTQTEYTNYSTGGSGTLWVVTRAATGGAGHVHVKADDTAISGDLVILPIWGAAGSLTVLSGTTTSAVIPVDISELNSASIQLVLVTSAAVRDWTVTAGYAYDTTTGVYVHDTGTSVLAAGTGSRSAQLLKKDRMALITITQVTGDETCWCYIVGRAIA